jgi:hypothetical protein
MLRAMLSGVCVLLACGGAAAQDIPGIENCAVEKTMERRTGCLQSNIDYLKRTTTQAALDQQQKLDAANRAIAVLQVQVRGLQDALTALKKSAESAKPADQQKPAATATSAPPADAKPSDPKPAEAKPADTKPTPAK